MIILKYRIILKPMILEGGKKWLNSRPICDNDMVYHFIYKIFLPVDFYFSISFDNVSKSLLSLLNCSIYVIRDFD